MPAAAQALAKDEWTFVRMAAADALGALSQDTAATNALAGGLSDASPKVRWTVDRRARQAARDDAGAVAYASASTTRRRTPRSAPSPRGRSARMCVQSAADRLTKLAYLARAPVDEADDRIGIAAIEALGALHPQDLEARLAPLRGKDVRMPVRRAAERAISEPTSCR